jgi:multidrug resistance efflux pump
MRKFLLTLVMVVGVVSPAVATWWLTNRKASWTDTYNALISSTTPTSNQWLTGRYLFINS